MLDGFCDMPHSAALSARIQQELADDATTESESDVQSEKLSDEAPTLLYPQQTAVAANKLQGVTLKDWTTSGMAVTYFRHAHSLR